MNDSDLEIDESQSHTLNIAEYACRKMEIGLLNEGKCANSQPIISTLGKRLFKEIDE